MIDWVVRVATGRTTLTAIIVFAVGSVLLFQFGPYSEVKALIGGANLPEEAVTSPGQLMRTLAAMGDSGRQSYVRFQAWDLLNPLLIGATGALLLGWMVRRGSLTPSAWRFAILVPLCSSVADLTENAVLTLAVLGFPNAAPSSAVLPAITAVKFGTLFVTMLLALFLGVRLLWARAALRPERSVR